MGTGLCILWSGQVERKVGQVDGGIWVEESKAGGLVGWLSG